MEGHPLVWPAVVSFKSRSWQHQEDDGCDEGVIVVNRHVAAVGCLNISISRLTLKAPSTDVSDSVIKIVAARLLQHI